MNASELFVLADTAPRGIVYGLPFGTQPTLLEWILILELVVLLTAAIFGFAARLLTRSDPYDPMVRFYRVFWRVMFKMSVPQPVEPAAAPRNAIFKVDAPAPSSGEAPDLATLDTLEPDDGVGLSEAEAASQSQVVISTRPRSAVRDDDPISVDVDAPPPRSSRGVHASVEPEPPRKQSQLDVRVLPQSARDEVAGIVAGELEIRVTRPPDDWQINGVVLELVARRIGVELYQVTLLKGHNRLRKTLQIAGLDAADVETRLLR